MEEGRGEYSTLEVVNRPSPPNPAQLEPAVDRESYPQVLSEYYSPQQEGDKNYDASTPYASTPYYQSQDQKAIPPYVGADGVPVNEGAGGGDVPSKRRQIWGLPVRTFWILVGIVAVAVVAAVVGGAVGGTLSHKNASTSTSTSSSGSNSTTTTTPTTSLSLDSEISAINWTDPNGFDHYALFSQDRWGALTASLWDSQNQTWTAINVSNQMALSGNPISMRAGTPLAGIATGAPDWIFQMNLYYLTPSNGIGEIFCKEDMTGKTWQPGSLTTEAPKVTSPNTSLTGFWHRCDYGCSQQLYLIYEDAQNNIQLLNSSNFSAPSLVQSNVDPGSGLSLIPFITDGGANGTNAGELRLYYDVNHDVSELKFGTDRKWGGDTTLRSNIEIQPQQAQYAASPFNVWTESLVVERLAGGNLTAHLFDGSTWHLNQEIVLRGGPASPSFARISMNEDNRFYGTVVQQGQNATVNDGNVYEYRWYSGDPYTFIYVGVVGIIGTNNTSS